MGLVRYVFIAGGLLGLSACSQEKAQTVEVIRPVKLMDINVVSKKVLSFPGEVQASEEAKLAFRVPGQIGKFHINSGQVVKKGDLLIELDPKDYEYMLQAESANFDLKTVTFQRNEVLIKDFLISQESYDISKSDMQVAESNFKTAQANLSYTKIYMPYDGIIANTYKEDFESIQAQEVVLSIQSDDAIDVVIDIPERLISTLREHHIGSGTKAKVSFPLNLGVEYDATYKEISTVADKDTGSYQVTLTLPKPEDVNLYSGMAATGLIELSYDIENLATKIPDSAFVRENGQSTLWKYLPDSNSLTKVSIPTEQETDIVSLLSSGDRIVIAGVNELTEESKVKPWAKERGL